ncbi:MAG: hypothetical protein KC609_13000 [Myxococcales bacterium]|nr:hypothetical protein [Myxococcales bacterium]
MAQSARLPEGVRTIWLFKGFFFPAIPLVLALSIGVGTFFGRTIAFDCRRDSPPSTGRCTIDERTAFYTIGHHEVPLEQIKMFSLNIVVSRDTKGRRNVNVPLYVHRHRGGYIELNDYSWFSDLANKQKVLAQLAEFLVDPQKTQVKATVGGHLTGLLVSLTVFGFAFAGLLMIGCVRLQVMEEPGHPKPLRIDVYSKGYSGLEITRHPYPERPEISVDPTSGQLTLRYPRSGQTSRLPALSLSSSTLERAASKISDFLRQGTS